MRILLYAMPILPGMKHREQECIDMTNEKIRDILSYTQDPIKEKESYYSEKINSYNADSDESFEELIEDIWDDLYCKIELLLDEYNNQNEDDDLFVVIESFDVLAYYKNYNDCYILNGDSPPNYESQILTVTETFMKDIQKNYEVELEDRELVMVATLCILQKNVPIWHTLFFPHKKGFGPNPFGNPFTGSS